MKSFFGVAALLTICCLSMPQAALHGNDIPQFLYTNDNSIIGSNTSTGFSVSGAALTPIPGSPFLTGGRGSGPPASDGIQAIASAALAPAQRCLFVSDGLSSDVAAFQINPQTGALAAAPGSPYATHSGGDSQWIGVAVAPSNKYVFAGDYRSSAISAFALASDCSLQFLQIYPTPLYPEGMKVTPDGRFLVVAYSGTEADTFAIGSDGSLTENGPFQTAGPVQSVDVLCNSRIAVFADTALKTEVEGFQISANGVLTALPGSPYKFNSGENSNTLAVNYGGNEIFISNQASVTQTALAFGAKRPYLSLVAGSPFANPAYGQPAGMAFNAAGNVLFVADDSPTPQITVYNINSGGTLTNAPGSPLFTGAGEGFFSLAAVPAPVCKK